MKFKEMRIHLFLNPSQETKKSLTSKEDARDKQRLL